MKKVPIELTLEELEELVRLKKQQIEAEKRQEAENWRKKVAPEAEKYGFVIVEKGQKPQTGRKRMPNLNNEENAAPIKAMFEAKKTSQQIADATGYGKSTIDKYKSLWGY